MLIRNVFYWFNVKQSMSNHWFIVSRYSFLIGFTIKISKSWMLNWFLVEGPETIKKFCTLHFLSKPDTCASPVTIVKPHKKKCQIYFRVTTSPLIAVSWNVTEMSILKRLILNLQKEKMMDLDNYIYKIFQAKYYYSSVKKSKFLLSWHLQIDKT